MNLVQEQMEYDERAAPCQINCAEIMARRNLSSAHSTARAEVSSAGSVVGSALGISHGGELNENAGLQVLMATEVC